MARNVLARKPGPDVKKIVLMAHFDTKIETPGAMDNASGVAVLLGLVQSLASIDLPVGLEFVAFNTARSTCLSATTNTCAAARRLSRTSWRP